MKQAIKWHHLKRLVKGFETFVKWRRLRKEWSLCSDASVACYLLILHMNHE